MDIESNLLIRSNLIPDLPVYRPIHRFLPGDFVGQAYPTYVDTRNIDRFLTKDQKLEHIQYLVCILCKRPCAGTCTVEAESPSQHAVTSDMEPPNAAESWGTVREPAPWTRSADAVAGLQGAVTFADEFVAELTEADAPELVPQWGAEALPEASDGAVEAVERLIDREPQKARTEFGLLTLQSNWSPLEWVRLGAIAERLEEQDAAVSAYTSALTSTDGKWFLAQAGTPARRALRAVLARSAATLPSRVRDFWILHLDEIAPDPTLLLLVAREAGFAAEPDMAGGLITQACLELVELRHPAVARKLVSELELPPNKALPLIDDLWHFAAQLTSEARWVAAELVTAIKPTQPTALEVLFYIDADRADARTIVDRLDLISEVIDVDSPEGKQQRARNDLLASISGPLWLAAGTLLHLNPDWLSTDRLCGYLSLAIEAALAAGDLSSAAQLLTDTFEKLGNTRLTPANIVGLADTLFLSPVRLSESAKTALLACYRAAAIALAEHPSNPDAALLEIILETARELDPSEGRSLRQQIEATGQPAGVAVVQPQVESPGLPLAELRIVIAGADPHIRQLAAKRMTALGAKEVVDIPPGYERVLNADQMFERLRGADLVLEVWRQTQHKTSEALQLALSRAVGVKRLYPPGTGFSSIVATAIKWATDPRRLA